MTFWRTTPSEFEDLTLDLCQVIMHFVFQDLPVVLPDISENPLQHLDTPTSLLLYLKDLMKYGAAANTKRGTVYVMGNTGSGKSSLVNTFQEYANRPSENPLPMLTGDNKELLETQILGLYSNINLKTTINFNIDVRAFGHLVVTTTTYSTTDTK